MTVLMLVMVSIIIGSTVVYRVISSLAKNNPCSPCVIPEPEPVVVFKKKAGRPKGAKNKKKRVVRRRTPKIDVFDEDEETV
jgi:hypothetical protein